MHHRNPRFGKTKEFGRRALARSRRPSRTQTRTFTGPKANPTSAEEQHDYVLKVLGGLLTRLEESLDSPVDTPKPELRYLLMKTKVDLSHLYDFVHQQMGDV